MKYFNFVKVFCLHNCLKYVSVMLVALPEMTPSKVLTLARCIASCPNYGDLFNVAKQLQFCKEVSRESFVRCMCLYLNLLMF